MRDMDMNTPVSEYPTIGYPAILDTTDLLPLVAEPSVSAFLHAQALPFRMSVDTVINDERGVFTGKKATLGDSFIQWLDSTTVRGALIRDPRIQLAHGLRVGLSKEQVRQRLQLASLTSDTLMIDAGFQENHTTLFFWQGRLHTVFVENMPD